MNINPIICGQNKLYAHNIINSKKYLFPITGFEINDKIEIGNTIFFKKGTEINESIPQISHKLFREVETLAFVDLENIPDIWKNKCDLSSIALQTLKQSIGVIYLAYYEVIGGIINEKRIVISNLNVHEIDEGLVPFTTEKEVVNFREPSKYLNMKLNDNLVTKIKSTCSVFNRVSNMTTEMECKVLKVIESLYYLNNEIYSLERILKICAFLNFVFVESKDDEKDFNKVASNVNQIFNYYDVDVLKNFSLAEKFNLVEKLSSVEKLSGSENLRLAKKIKLNVIMNEIHTEIRNKYSHGKIDLYQEFSVIHENQYNVFRIVIYELLKLLMFNKDFSEIKSSKELNEFVVKVNKEFRSKNNG